MVGSTLGTIRRECVDYFIPINERHLLLILEEFVAYYYRGRPSFRFRPWHTRTDPVECSGRRAQASASRRSPDQLEADPRWIASGLSIGKGGRL